MSLADRDKIHFRLPPDQMARLEKAAEARGITRQAFMTDAIMAEVALVEEEYRHKKGKRGRRSSSDLDEPTGLGIAAAAARRREAAEQPPASAAPQGQVVVNVGGSGASTPGGDAVERLAAYVASGPDYERQSRLRTAVDVLRDSATTDEERMALAERLNKAIDAKVKPREGDGAKIARGARVAFDKIKDLLGSDS